MSVNTAGPHSISDAPDSKIETRDNVLWLWVVAAVVLRVVWLLTRTVVIENEGGEYARLGDNLLSGHGYIGLIGPNAAFPPLYPWFIGIVTEFTRNSELSGRLISIVMGSLLVVAVYKISLILFDRTAARVAAGIVSLHPLLIAFSASVFSESTYFAFLFGGLYYALRSLDSTSMKSPLFAGLLFGMAYLTRPEGIIYTVLVVAALAVQAARGERDWRLVLRHSAIFMGCALTLAMPYILFLKAHTGSFHLEYKSPYNDQLMARMATGMGVQEAAQGLNADSTEAGPSLAADQFHLKPMKTPGLVEHFRRGQPGRTAELARNITSFASKPLVLFAVIGFAVAVWRRDRAVPIGVFALASASVVIILLSMWFIFPRFYLPTIPFLVVWASNGIVGLSFGLKHILSRLTGHGSAFAFTDTILSWIVCAWIALSAWPVERVVELRDTYKSTLKEAGEWINTYRPGPKLVMAFSSPGPYYARATISVLPYAPAKIALVYIHRKKPDFIILKDDELEKAPYVEEWISKGIPDQCAKLVNDLHGVGQRTVVYEWTCE